jgi:3-deoxy-manno-octulosonate cytidylyltransferase (CMP-KDO synthetase)
MIQRVYERAREATLLNDVVVATDDHRIEEVVRRFGGRVMMTPSDLQSGSDRVAAASQQIPGEIYVNVQGDEPLIAPTMIDAAVRVILEDPKALVGTLAKRISDPADLLNPGIVKVTIDKGGYALYFSRSAIPYVRDEHDPVQWLDHGIFYKHVGIYVFRAEVLKAYSTMKESMLEKSEKLEQLRILENGIRMKVGITNDDSFPVDTAEDADRVRTILEKTHSTT